MYFNVSQILNETSGSARSFQVDETVALTDGGPESRIRGTVQLLRTDQGIWVSATLDSEVSCLCSLCLKECSYVVNMGIEEEFLPSADVNGGTRLRAPGAGDESFYINPDQMLDLTEAARQYFQLNIPMKPVCRDSCAGICLTCGADQNETRCQCSSPVVDSRWNVLLEAASPNDAQV